MCVWEVGGNKNSARAGGEQGRYYRGSDIWVVSGMSNINLLGRKEGKMLMADKTDYSKGTEVHDWKMENRLA